MAATPAADSDIIDRFGPHLAYSVGPNPRAAAEPDRLVKTHCCFCGQQCGIQLKVKGNQVVGFEPWEEFPFNRGMLCPKGVKRYLQGSHPDRLLSAYERDPNARGGFIAGPLQPCDRKSRRCDPAHPVGPRQRRLRRAERRQSDDGKGLLDGQVRPRLPQDAVHRLQRPAVHGQRRRRQQEGVRHRPRRQPLGRHSQGQGGVGQRRQHRRMRPDHDALCLAGAGTRGQGRHGRSAHHAGRADLRPVPARQAGPRRRPLQRRPAPDDRKRLDRPRLHRGDTPSASRRSPSTSATGRRGAPPR